MKRYIAVLVGIVVLSGVVFGGYKFIKSRTETLPVQAETVVRMRTFTGGVMREFEGQNVLNYSFEIPESATTTIEMEGALIKILDANPYVTMYISYEGLRGYGPVDYMDAVISPHVSVINLGDIEKLGAYEWQTAETEASEWRIAPVDNGKWLVIVENKKLRHEEANKTLESFKAN